MLYFPWWQPGNANQIDYSKVTDINYFSVYPNSNGNLVTENVKTNDLNAIVGNSHVATPLVNVLISVGGWGYSDDFPAMAASDSARTNFVNNIVQFVNDNGLDGVDIDWEPVDTETKKDNQAKLLSDLKTALPDKLVTVAVDADRLELRSSSANVIDWVNVMAYDMNWSKAEHSLYSHAVAALDRYDDIISKEKLNMGVPFYGRDDGWNSYKPYRDFVYDVIVTNSDNNSDSLPNSFTVSLP